MSTLSRKPFQLGSLLVHFASLNFEQLDALQPEIALLVQPGGANFARTDSRAAIVKVATASLEHEPGISEDVVRRNLDIANFPLVIGQIFERNHFIDDEPGEGDASGEARAAASAT